MRKLNEKMKEVIAVFDIGKTNKKFLLFDESYELVSQDEMIMPVAKDEDGFECDDIERIEFWIKDRLSREIEKKRYNIKGVNFSTYGASLVFLDKEGKRLTPVYNYLKKIPVKIAETLYENNGGKDEFCRRTASPALGGMLNSGMQILWLKNYKKEIFKEVKYILHFPQYLSFLLTGHVLSEYTSIGCHTGMWDFDSGKYHPWLEAENIILPKPVNNSCHKKINLSGHEFFSGTGIHDSSASLVPFLMGNADKFILISTGTWCINMNPFNYNSLTKKELDNDCLCYLSVMEKPVKSSRFFMGHIHDANLRYLNKYFGVDQDTYKNVDANPVLLKSFFEQKERSESMFFQNGVSDEIVDGRVVLSCFNNFEEAYQRLVFDLTLLNARSIDLVLGTKDDVKKIFICGGFARNEIFLKSMSLFFPDKKILTSKIDNASALGAAMMLNDLFFKKNEPVIDLNLKEWN